MQLHAKDKIFKLLFDSAAEGLIVCDKKGVIHLNNPTAAKMFGYSNDELVGKTIEDLMTQKFRQGHHQKREQYSKSPSQRKMGIGLDLEGLRKSGELFPVEISLNQMEIEGEAYVMALISDITERKRIDLALKEKQAELKTINQELEDRIKARTAELEESQRLYSIISQNFPSGTINVFDEDLKYVFAEGKELFERGITSKKLQGTSYEKRIPENAKEVIIPRLKDGLKGINSSFDMALGDRHFIFSVVGLHNYTGNIDQVLLVEQNITQQKLAEDNIRAALEKEKDLNELKSRFVSMASHEFRTPLSTILSSTSLLTKYLEKPNGSVADMREKQLKHLKKIKTSVSNLTGILNDFLSLDKLESGNITLKAAEFGIEELIEEVESELGGILKPNQKLNISIEKDVDCLTLDRNVIKNILLNLLSNAFKYSLDDGEIDWTTIVKGKLATIRISDHGIGIPKDEQQYLFDRFFRAKNVTNIEGTGLGLNIVKRYVDLMDGTIKFKSVFGEGTTFQIEIPINNG